MLSSSRPKELPWPTKVLGFLLRQHHDIQLWQLGLLQHPQQLALLKIIKLIIKKQWRTNRWRIGESSISSCLTRIQRSLGSSSWRYWCHPQTFPPFACVQRFSSWIPWHRLWRWLDLHNSSSPKKILWIYTLESLKVCPIIDTKLTYHKFVVENNVDSAFNMFVASFISLVFSWRVGTIQNDISFLANDVLALELVDEVVNQLVGEWIGGELVIWNVKIYSTYKDLQKAL